MLQAGRSLVPIPTRSCNFFLNLPNPSSRTITLGWTQPLTEMLPGIFLGVNRGRHVNMKTSPPSVRRLSKQCGIFMCESRWPRGTLYPQKLAPTSLISGGLSVGIVRSRTQATEFSFSVVWMIFVNNQAIYIFLTLWEYYKIMALYFRHPV
jgi:hypothetical protein